MLIKEDGSAHTFKSIEDAYAYVRELKKDKGIISIPVEMGDVFVLVCVG